MDTMQAEALRRAQEMHRGRENHQYTRPPANSQRERHRESTENEKTNNTDSIAQNRDQNCIVTENKPSPILFEDKEKLLILVLIMILCSEDSSDPTLILALLYLII